MFNLWVTDIKHQLNLPSTYTLKDCKNYKKLDASNTGSSLNILQFDIQFTASIQLCIPGEPQPRGAENPALHLVMIPQGSQYHQKQQGTTYKGQLLLHFFK